jgi:hypothetical protein
VDVVLLSKQMTSVDDIARHLMSFRSGSRFRPTPPETRRECSSIRRAANE